MRRTIVVSTVGTALLALMSSAATASAPAGHEIHQIHGKHGTSGSPGIGDPYFPDAGNGGYDVKHYSLNLGYQTSTKHLSGQARIIATATQNLSRFDLDLRPDMTVSSVRVNGSAADLARSGQELVLTPRHTLHNGAPFIVTVRYGGTPGPVTDPDGSPDGWIPTDDGAFLANEPQGAPSWFPSNDHPLDKATFDVTMTVPKGLTVIGNGRLAGKSSQHGRSTFTWVENRPMATYLATATFGRFQVSTGRTADGIPTIVAVDPREAADAAPALAKLPQMVAFEQRLFGKYPFETVGAIVDHAPQVGYALETQTKPVFDRAPDDATLVHELAHQWYGDSVSLTRWQDIWLNEGFATYAEWLWTAHTGGVSTQQTFDQLYARPASDTDLWNPPSGNPGSGAEIFGESVYARGAMTLQALRARVGDRAFFRILRDWAAGHRYGHGTTAQFISLAERDSGRDLDKLFQVWLFSEGKPTTW